jgi:hypothetical protein
MAGLQSSKRRFRRFTIRTQRIARVFAQFAGRRTEDLFDGLPGHVLACARKFE